MCDSETSKKLQKSVVMCKFKTAMTVKDLKNIVKDWPEINTYTGEDCEVWLVTGKGASSPVTGITPLNKKMDNGIVSADILFETTVFDI